MLTLTKSLNKIPVFYGYVIAFEARNLKSLQDCNVGTPNLCQQGAQFIRDNTARILERYDYHSSHIASYIGTNGFCIFLIEPDFYQYYGDTTSQAGGAMTGPQMRTLFDNIAQAIRKNLPNAAISWDISPWLSTTDMQTWWGYFATSPYINFIHTSGGEAQGDQSQIKPNELTWSFMSSLTGKKIIADAGNFYLRAY